MSDERTQTDEPLRSDAPEDPGEPSPQVSHEHSSPLTHVRGAEGGNESDAAKKGPATPAGDDSPLGDTDQHSES